MVRLSKLDLGFNTRWLSTKMEGWVVSMVGNLSPLWGLSGEMWKARSIFGVCGWSNL